MSWQPNVYKQGPPEKARAESLNLWERPAHLSLPGTNQQVFGFKGKESLGKNIPQD